MKGKILGVIGGLVAVILEIIAINKKDKTLGITAIIIQNCECASHCRERKMV